MTRILLVVALAAAWSSAAAAAELPATLVEPYLRVQTALAADKTDTLKQDGAAIAQAAAVLGEPARKVAEAGERVARAGELKSARAAFGDLSAALLAYAKATGASMPAGVSLAYCPMVDKSWLQKGTILQNPYYGREMLMCGEFKR